MLDVFAIGCLWQIVVKVKNKVSNGASWLITSLREFLTKYKVDAEVINKEGGY